MGRFFIAAAILAISYFSILKRDKNRREFVVYFVSLVFVIFCGYIYFLDPDTQGFVQMVLSSLGIKE